MNRKHYFCFLLGCLSIVMASCTTDDPKPDPTLNENVNAWIYDIMEKHYMWYDEIPAKESLDMTTDPEKFFNLLLSDKDGKVLKGETEHHYFSRIEKKKTSTKSIDEESTYGFDFATAKIPGTNTKVAWIIYTLPNSPATEAGLKRGDWILAVNSETPNITDISVLRSGNAVKFYTGTYNSANKSWTITNSVNISASRPVENTPFLKDSVYHYGDKHIGYLAYNHFSSGPDGYEDKTWDKQMKQIFANFKSQNVNEFVLDLRYNGGGLVTSAQLLTSMLAPAKDLGKTFCKMEYNDKYKDNNRSLALESAGAVSAENLDLQRLYVLVGPNSASASEAVINCLIPYMGRSNITLIGEQTIGKTVGSEQYGDNQDYDWLISPIVLHIKNADGNADYEDGFVPDIKLEELFVNNTLYPLGDRMEMLLSAAFNQILNTGLKSTPIENTEHTKIFFNPILNKRTNGMLLLPQ